MINPLGTDVDTVWNALINAQSGVGYISVFDASSYPTRIAAEVHGWTVAECGQDPQVWAKRGEHARFAAECGAASHFRFWDSRCHQRSNADGRILRCR
ncbi:MAG: hypothetical protein R3C56_22670 [Pirellulaceae bacterium]